MCPTDAIPTLETREALIQAALTCFAKYGYEATSIRLVASMAGKNSSLISYYFKGKEGLYREVFRFLLDRFALKSIPWEAPRGDGRTRLRTHFHRVLTEVDAHFDGSDPLQEPAIRLWMSELQAPRHEVKDLLRARMEPFVEDLRACLRALRPDLPPAEVDFWGITLHGCCLAHTLLAEMNRLVWGAPDPARSLDAMADRMTDFACGGLGAS